MIGWGLGVLMSGGLMERETCTLTVTADSTPTITQGTSECHLKAGGKDGWRIVRLDRPFNEDKVAYVSLERSRLRLP